MTRFPSFGARLAHFMERRELDVSTLGSVSALELQTVIKGSAPDASLLLRLAPALGLHVQDLFVLADTAVPQELAPLDPSAGAPTMSIAFAAATLPTRRIHELRQCTGCGRPMIARARARACYRYRLWGSPSGSQAPGSWTPGS